MNCVPEIKNKTIVYGVLNWGLGHASRSAAIIKQLLMNHNTVYIVSWDKAFIYLKNEFPQCNVFDLKNLSIQYPKHKHVWWSLLLQLNKFKKAINRETIFINNFVEKNKIDLIISDNCYGFYHQSIQSIIITHQINLQTPFLKNFITKKIKNYLNHFNQIWIPDYADNNCNLAGKLSHSAINNKCIYIGPQSNLTTYTNNPINIFEYEYCAILSGPEQFRTQFENKIIAFLNKQNKPAVIIRGVYETNKPAIQTNPNITIIQNAQGEKLNQTIFNSNIIICACGYSSIMDMYLLQKKCLMLPTPGQTEQEYLWQKHFNTKHKDLSKIEVRLIKLNDN